MSVPPTLIAVTSMLSVVTLMGLTLARVKQDTLEMAKVVLVSNVLERGTKNFKFLSAMSRLKTCYLTSIIAYPRYKLTSQVVKTVFQTSHNAKSYEKYSQGFRSVKLQSIMYLERLFRRTIPTS